MCGGTSTTTQSTTIPPEVLARYNAVNARAEEVAGTPFKPYTGQFVAPINQQQMAGIGNINAAANMATPYFNQATQALNTAYGQATPLYNQSLGSIASGMQQANNLYGTALSGISNGVNIGSQYGTDATRFYNQAGTSAQPYMSQANQYVTAGLGAASPLMQQSQNFLTGSTAAVNPEEFNQAQINRYMSPYQSKVIEAQTKLAEQQNAIQRGALNSQAIGAGAFGGDRAGIAQANLAGQQSLAQQATMANLLQQGYGQAANMFQQQQGVNLQAGQANRAAQQFGQQAAANLAQQAFGQNLAASQQTGNLGQALFGQQMAQGQAMQGLGQQLYAQNLGAAQAQAGIAQNQFGMSAQQAAMQQAAAQGLYGMGAQYASGLAGLGTGAQAAALQGAQAQIGAGTLQQQTQQADLTANYQQFLQERGYPFQVAQFLANIAMGTGALSGSTTTTTGPSSFFSDRRLKKDVKEIGETHDGLPIYSFKYKNGDDLPRIGVMADEAREKHPDAVRRVGGVDAVDYEKIADRASEGGGVMPSRAGQGYAMGGNISDQDLASILAMQREFLGPNEKGGLYGQSAGTLPGVGGVVPQKAVHVARLQHHGAPPRQQNEGQQALAAAEQAEKVGTKLFGDKGYLTKEGPLAKGFSNARQAIAGGQPDNKAGMPAGQAPAGNRGAPPPHPNAPAPAKISSADSASGVMPEEVKSEDLDSLFSSQFAARGGGVRPGLKFGGADIYKSDNPIISEEILEVDTPEKIGQDSSRGGGGGGSSGSGLSQAIGMAGSVASAGTALAKALPALMALIPSDERFKSDMKKVGELDNGQPVYKYRIGDGPTQIGLSAQNVSKYGDPSAVHRDKDGFLYLDYDRATREYGGGVRPAFQQGGPSEEQQRYKIDPVPLEEMPEHRRKMVLDIYGPESGGRYDIRNGGQETFDPNGPHPGRAPAKGGTSSASGAGQFIYDTWQNVTGGAPMTKPYQDNATWTLAAQDYNKRTGRDLDVDLQESGGVTPEIRRVLAPTWEAYAKTGGVKPAEGGPRRQVASAESVMTDGRRTDLVDGKEQKSAGQSFLDTITSPRVLAPLGTGILAMASSPSRYFGGALLTGLGAGLAATQPAEASAARIEAQNLENIGTGIDLATRGFKELPNGMIVVILPNGRQLSYPDWVKAGEPTPVGGQIGAALIKEKAAKLGLNPAEMGSATKEKPVGTTAGTAVAQPQAPASTGTQPAAPAVAPQAPQANPLQYTVNVPDSARQSAEEEERQLYSMAAPDMQAQVARNNAILSRAQGQKEAAIVTGKKLTELAAPLASMAAGQQIAPGYFAKLQAFASDVYNGAVDAANLPPEFRIKNQGLTDYQIAQKASTILTSEMARNLNQDAYAALQYLAQGVANPSMQAASARELLANAMVENQAALEEALFIQKYAQGRSKTVAQRASDEFRLNNTPEMYKKEKDAVKKLLAENINGVPVINYILRTGDNRDPELQKRFDPNVINQKYGFNITRYILNMAN